MKPQFDHRNQLTKIEKQETDGGTVMLRVEYDYDVFGRRIREDQWESATGTVTTKFSYDGDDIWLDLDGSDNLKMRFIRPDGIDQLAARIDAGDNVGWYHADVRQSIVLITDNSATTLNSISYDGFGNPTQTNQNNGDRFLYTGREFNVDTGLDFRRFRYYDSATGRWITVDPIGFSAGDANLYRYVGNNPTNHRDPDGLFSLYNVMRSIEQNYPEVHKWMKDRNVLVRGFNLNWAERRYSSWSDGKIRNGRPVIYLWNGMSDAEALGYIVRMTTSSVYDTEISDDFKKYQLDLDNVARGRTDPRNVNRVTRKQLASTTLGGAQVLMGVYTSLSGGVMTADIVIHVSDRGLSERDLLTLLPMVKRFPGGVKVAVKQGKQIRRYTTRDLLRIAEAMRRNGARPQARARVQRTMPRQEVRLGTARATIGGRGPRALSEAERNDPVVRAYLDSRASEIRQAGFVPGDLSFYTVGLHVNQQVCFVAGTPLLTPTGEVSIDELKPGDEVLSRPEANVEGSVEAKVVEEVFVRTGVVFEVCVGGRAIRTTPEHPFFVRGAGWKATKELQPGDQLSSHDGQWVAVDAVRENVDVTTVYNVRVADFHTYFVGARAWGFSVWAHNAKYFLEKIPGRSGFRLVDEGGKAVKNKKGIDVTFGSELEALAAAKVSKFDLSVAPRSATGRIAYGSSDLSQVAQQARRQTGTFSARNAAVVEYRAADGSLRTMTTFSERGVGHAEQLLAKDLDALGVKPSQVTRIYTELEPCSVPGGYCKDFINRTFPDAKVTYSFEYDADVASRRAGVDALREAAGQLRNVGN